MSANETKLAGDVRASFIGCGVMAEAIVAGLLREEMLSPDRIFASHPREERRRELAERYGIHVSADNCETAAAAGDSFVFLCVKPQRLGRVLEEIKDSVSPAATVVSIVAGATIRKIGESLAGENVIRVMPNTPSQIGAGMCVWTASPEVPAESRDSVKTMLRALGKELYVETENMIDMATSLSATGPTFTFMVMEALTDAGVHLGFSREVAKELVQETMLGSVKFAMESHKHPAELRNMVTSPGGTSAEAIYQMEKGGLRTVLSKAAYAAYRRAVELGKK